MISKFIDTALWRLVQRLINYFSFIIIVGYEIQAYSLRIFYDTKATDFWDISRGENNRSAQFFDSFSRGFNIINGDIWIPTGDNVCFAQLG